MALPIKSGRLDAADNRPVCQAVKDMDTHSDIFSLAEIIF